jgi:hypothetical protein
MAPSHVIHTMSNLQHDNEHSADKVPVAEMEESAATHHLMRL